MLGASIAVLGGASQAMAQNYNPKSGDTTLGQARYVEPERQAQAIPTEEILRVEPAAGPRERIQNQNAFADFRGPYVGGSVGFGMGNAEISNPAGADGDVGMDGITGGVFAGYGYESSTLIAGLAGYGSVELGYEWSDVDGDLDVASFEKSDSWNATFRPGISINNGTLGYGIVGYSRAQFEGSTNDENFDGLMLGAGTEFNTRMPLRMRVEYVYTNYEDDNLGGTGFDYHESAIKGGAVLRF